MRRNFFLGPRESNFLLPLADRLGLDPAGHKNFETNEWMNWNELKPIVGVKYVTSIDNFG